MKLNYVWRGAGWYATRTWGTDLTMFYKVNMDGWRHDQAGEAAHDQGLGTPRRFETEDKLKQRCR